MFFRGSDDIQLVNKQRDHPAASWATLFNYQSLTPVIIPRRVKWLSIIIILRGEKKPVGDGLLKEILQLDALALPKTNSKCLWKWMEVGRLVPSFWGKRPMFRCYVSFRECIATIVYHIIYLVYYLSWVFSPNFSTINCIGSPLPTDHWHRPIEFHPPRSGKKRKSPKKYVSETPTISVNLFLLDSLMVCVFFFPVSPGGDCCQEWLLVFVSAF